MHAVVPVWWRAECWALGQAWRVSRRGRWYAAVCARLLVLGVVAPGRTRAARLGFFVLQYVDDLADGDQQPPAGVTRARMIAAVQDAWVAGTRPEAADAPSAGMIAALAALRTALRADRGGRGAWADTAVARLMATMTRDLHRRTARQLWSGEQIAKQLAATFADSLGLTMVAAGGRRGVPADVPSLIAAMAWCSVVRDFRDDLENGICNVPAEVVRRSGVEEFTAHVDDLVRSDAVASWWQQERARIAPHVVRARGEVLVPARADRSSAMVLQPFVRAVERWYAVTADGPPRA